MHSWIVAIVDASERSKDSQQSSMGGVEAYTASHLAEEVVVFLQRWGSTGWAYIHVHMTEQVVSKGSGEDKFS